jgi:hypothetical protein
MVAGIGASRHLRYDEAADIEAVEQRSGKRVIDGDAYSNQGRPPPIMVGSGPRHVGAIRTRRSIVPV